MLIWDKNLRCTQKLKGKCDKIKKRAEKKRLLSVKTYCIALPSNSDNVLDIYNMGDFLFDHYRKDETKIHIIGIAESNDAAVEMVRDIIDEVYKETGTFDVERYFLNA